MVKINFLDEKLKKNYPQNDIGTSRLFIDSFSDELIFVADQNEWFWWNEKHWERDVTLKRNELMKKLAVYCIKYVFEQNLENKMQSDLLKYYAKLSDKNTRDRILRDAMSINPIVSNIFDKHKFLFNCQNGTYNFKTKEFKKHNKSDLITDISNVVYDPNADCPRFKQYLLEVMENDTVKVDYLLKIAAYILTGDTSRECFFVLYGDKTRNGKGTFVSTLTHIAGTYAQTLKPASITRKQINNGGAGPSPDIAKLKNCRIASVNELEEGMLLDVALIKTMTGGDTMTARHLQKEEFEFTPQFKILINTNSLPRMSDDSIFNSDRIHLVLFDRHFEENERDIHLKDKLKEETAGIFNLIASYYIKLETEGFILPDSTKQTIAEYKLNSNNVLAFTKECMLYQINALEKASTVYNKYKEWCNEMGLRFIPEHKNFKEKMKRLGAEYTEKMNGKDKDGVWSYTYWVRNYTFLPENKQVKGSETYEPVILNDGDLPF